MSDTEQLKRVCAEATQGPYVWDAESQCVRDERGYIVWDHSMGPLDRQERADRDFILTFPPIKVSELLTRIEVLEGERDEARKALLRVDPDWYSRDETPCAWPECGCDRDAICDVTVPVLAEEGRADLATTRALTAEAELSRVNAEGGRMRSALEAAVSWFRGYEHQHYSKGTEDGMAKAATNAKRADFLQAALQPQQGAPEEGL